jgi:hypothetical protein
VKVKALTGFCIGSGENVEAGQVFETDEYNARRWTQMGYVVPAEADPAPPPVSGRRAGTLDVIETREPEPEHREPRMRREEE